MSLELLKSMLPRWPKAVDPTLICDPNDKAQKIERATNIIDQFITQKAIKNKSFLDFGCGDGFSVPYALKKGAKKAVGYDPAVHGENIFNDFNQIAQQGPFDVIMVYDVFDHVADPIECVKQIKSVSHNKTIINVLTHPWFGRTGGHLYHTFNYAYAHVIFTDEELLELGVTPIPMAQKVVKPIMTYKNWFNKMVIKHHDIVKDNIESFFEKEPILKERIINAFSSTEKTFPQFQLEQSFHEFTLALG